MFPKVFTELFVLIASVMLYSNPSALGHASPLHSASPSEPTINFPSQLFPGASISYKEARRLSSLTYTTICETTPGVKSFSGYVHLPSSLIADSQIPGQPYDLNTFFWYFEARNDAADAPTTIYFAGGPGESSIASALDGEGGPCVVQDDSNSTVLNPWSWNMHSNILYIDQPNMAGFSYDQVTKGSLDLLTGNITPVKWLERPNMTVVQNQTSILGQFPSQNPNNTALTCGQGARAIWHFAQYAGYYVPAYASFIEHQNQKIANNALNVANTTKLPLNAIGITNGCVDVLVNGAFYPILAYNNTYGLKGINQAVFQDSLNNFTKPNGCVDLTNKCRELGSSGDPDELGLNATVNQFCAEAFVYCFEFVQAAFPELTDRSAFDIAQPNPNPFPFEYFVGYLNQPWVQEALGVKVNYTQDSIVTANDFEFGSGDAARRNISDLNFLLSHGIKVSLIFGDRDYRCNWLAGEAVSLNVTYPDATNFRASGYENITTNDTYVGGVVRQYGNFSFSRIFDAGHSVQAYQPETVSRIFNRVLLNKDVATGHFSTIPDKHGSVYSSNGPNSSFWIKNKLPEPMPSRCYFWSYNTTCNENQIAALMNGTAVIKDLFVIEPPN
ncbi:MAG: hypothetical protein M1821_008328 [Bathelium mastoideum]|nr:MAG: hypothetical protein M1821_008328 [Bathelium mastoideum]